MKKSAPIFVILCIFLFCGSVKRDEQWENVKIITENLAPLGYVDIKSNKLKGETAEKIQAAMKKLGIKKEIEVYPWARALSIAKTEPDVFIFNLARTAEREEKFKWVYKTKIKKIGVFKLKSRKDIVIKDMSDLKKYRVTVLNKNIAHIKLIETGIYKDGEANFYPMAEEDSIIQFLNLNRADVWIKTYIDENDVKEKEKEFGIESGNIVKIFEIKNIEIQLYLAASLQTSDEKIMEFREAVEAQYK